MTEWLMMKVMGSMPAIPEIITGWGAAGVEAGAESARENRGAGAGGADPGVDHDGKERRRDGRGASGCLRNGGIDDRSDDRAGRDQKDAERLHRAREELHEMHVGLCEAHEVCKTHCRADRLNEAGIGHALSELIEARHRVERNAAEEEAGGEEHEPRFNALYERNDRKDDDDDCRPEGKGWFFGN